MNKSHPRFAQKLAMCIFENKRSTVPIKSGAGRWEKIVKAHNHREIRISKDGWMIGGYALNGARSNANVLHRTLIQLDIDTSGEKDKQTDRILKVHKVAPTLDEIRPAINEYEWFAYSSHSHEPQRGVIKYRLVILPDRNISQNEYGYILAALNELLGGALDKNAFQWSQAFFAPSCPPEAESDTFFEHNQGMPLPIDEFVERGKEILTREMTATPSDPFGPGNIPALSSDLATPENIARYKSALDAIDPDVDRVEWRNICWAVMATGWKCAPELAREWSERGEKYRKPDFDRVVASFKPDGGISIGTLFHHAKMHGWIDPRKMEPTQEPTRSPSVSEDWETDRSRKIKSSLKNAKLAMRKLGVKCSYDKFRNRKMVYGHDKQEFHGELTDHHCTVLRNVVLEKFGFDPGRDHTRDALDALCLENSFHPVREYLDGLEWDGVPRLKKWVSTYLGAHDTRLNRAIGRSVLIAAVRRVRQPGCKFDSIMVLEGKQGSGKSSAISILAGKFFSDSNLLSLDTKGQIEALEGVWIYEIGELSGLHRTDEDLLKAFISRQMDRGRPAYARFREDRPRQCVFIGTTNGDRYLTDQTGNRRWWPVKTGAIDLGALTADRDQLWAEAAFLENQGASITLPKNLWRLAAAVQAARLEVDPWLDPLSSLAAGKYGVVAADGALRISSADVISNVLNIPTAQQHQKHTKRLGELMRRLGWTGPKSVRINNQVVRGYERPIDADE